MDIAYYLSELLGELGGVNVPGLGSFTQQRIDGYYKSSEGKFYPPTAEVNYSEDYTEDDILAEYIAEKKKISLASSKYFIEKYSSKIKVDVLMEDVQVAGLGWIYPHGNGLAFKRSGLPVTDPASYGYPKIALHQSGIISSAGQAEVHTLKPEDKPVLLPVLEDTPAAEPETESATQGEQSLPPVLQDLPAAEPEIIGDLYNEPATPAILQHEPVVEPEAVSEYEKPSSPAEEADITNADPVGLIDYESDAFKIKEPVNAPLDFGAQMEDYLRELEAGAYISGPEISEQSILPEQLLPKPLIELPAQEIVPEQVIELPESEPVPEAMMETPKAEPFHEQLTDIFFPENIPSTNTKGPEPLRYISDESPATPQPGAYIPVPVTSPQYEEEFIFDGKGYDDVDTRRTKKTSYLWLWITMGILLLLAAAAAFIYYKHEQALKMRTAVVFSLKPVIKTDTGKKAAQAESLKDTTQNKVIRDTTLKAVASPSADTAEAIDSTKVRYELIAIKCKTISEANLRIKNYKSIGITGAHIITGHIDGRLIKVSLGTYLIRADAIKRKHELARKVSSIEIKKINPKK